SHLALVPTTYVFFSCNDPATTERSTLSHTTLFRSTVTGKTVRENIAGAKVHLRDVIHSVSDPVSSEPATGVLFGNLAPRGARLRSEEHTSELQSQSNLVCRLLLEKKKEDKPEET